MSVDINADNGGWMMLPDEQVGLRQPRWFALQLQASLREPGGARVPVRVIDIAAEGCRIEQLCAHALPPFVWLYPATIDAQYARVIWNREHFAEIRFDTPLHDAVLNNLLAGHQSPVERDIPDLRNIARRVRDLADRSSRRSVFAVGDLRSGSVKRVASSVGDGAQVVAALHAVLAAREDKAAPNSAKTAS